VGALIEIIKEEIAAKHCTGTILIPEQLPDQVVLHHLPKVQTPTPLPSFLGFSTPISVVAETLVPFSIASSSTAANNPHSHQYHRNINNGQKDSRRSH
jgi:hypothetical protein